MKNLSRSQRQSAMEDFLLMRGIDAPELACEECGGFGVKLYGDTSTWRGGVGGQAFTSGVCDHCWGSGQKHRPWPSHREFASMKAALSSIRKEG